MKNEKFGPVRVGLLGIGTVGGGTFEVLRRNQDEIRRRAGRSIEITKVADLDVTRARAIVGDAVQVVGDARDVVNDPQIDVVVELIGGYGIARTLVLEAIEQGKHVVTANKALLAVHGNEIFLAASKKGVMVAFEAAVAGGIPIIKALREGLTANRIEWIAGIINGTTNFILSEMRDKGLPFDVALEEAQRLGYAEADPTFDVDGIDAAHKLAVLTGAAFGAKVDFAGVHVEGIRRVTSMDIQFAQELGYRIKLLGLARETRHGIEQRVHPCMVPLDTPIAHIEGVFNAVVVEGDFVGTTMFQGRGAGQGPTASAVVADLVDVARGRHMPAFVVPAEKLATKKASPMDRHVGAYYMRLMVQDRPGVIAAVSGALAKERISLESMLQRGRSESGEVPVVLTTHETEEAAMQRALARIAKLGAVAEEPCVIRIEAF